MVIHWHAVLVSVLKSKAFFVSKKSMRSRFERGADQSCMIVRFHSLCFFLRMHSETCPLQSLETRMGVWRPLRVASSFKLSRLTVVNDSPCLVLPRLGRYFSVDRKSFPKSFRLDRQGKRSVVSFRNLSFSLLEKYPEWMLWLSITRPVSTIEWQMLKKGKIRSFCQRKGTNLP